MDSDHRGHAGDTGNRSLLFYRVARRHAYIFSHCFNEALIKVKKAIDCWFWTLHPEYFVEETSLAQATIIIQQRQILWLSEMHCSGDRLRDQHDKSVWPAIRPMMMYCHSSKDFQLRAVCTKRMIPVQRGLLHFLMSNSGNTA